MRGLIGFIIGFLSVILAAYVGIWVMFIGGIVGIVDGIVAANGVMIGFGILKILFCEVSALIAVIGIMLGMVIAEL